MSSLLQRTVITAALLLLSVISAGPALASDPFASFKMSRLPAGSMVAPFELTALDGKVVKSSELSGKVVLVNFWATWCGPCKEEMPSLARLQKQLDPTQFILMTVTTDLQRQGIAHFLAQLGVTLPVLFDEDQEVSRSFMVRGLPTTVVIARDGTLVGRAVGPRAWDSPESVAVMRQVMESGK
ncbi:MAG: TlpA disulfide reductase family protein [Nitrospira sp.]